MFLEKLTRFLEGKVYLTSRYFVMAGAFVFCSLMLLTVEDITARYLFNSPWVGTYEVSQWMMICLVFSGLALCQCEGKHIIVDLLKIPRRLQAGINIVTTFLSISLYAIITWQTTVQAFKKLDVGETGAMTHVPVAIFFYVVALGSALLCIALLIKFFHDVIEVTTK